MPAKVGCKRRMLGVRFSTMDRSTALSAAWVRSMKKFNKHAEGVQPELRRREAASAYAYLIGKGC